MTKPLIIGYDPGTTSGLAILDTGKNIVYLDSKRDLKTKDLLLSITERGNPIIVTGDKNPLPKSVEKLASSLGCKTFEPSEDLSNIEKYSLVKEYMEIVNDDHQKDALASALKAYKNYSSLFRKTDRTISYLGLSEFYDKILKLLINEKARNIDEAVNLALTEIKTKKERLLEGKKTKKEKITREKVDELRKRLKVLKNDNEILRNYNENLKKRLENVDEKFRGQKKKNNEFHDEKKNQENKKTHRLEKELEKRNIAIEKLKTLRKLENNGYVPVINLGSIKPDKVELLDKMLDLENRVVSTNSFSNLGVLNDYRIKALIAPNIPDKEVIERINFPLIVRKELIQKEIEEVLVIEEKDFKQKFKKAKKSGFIQWINGYRQRRL
ncbi:MAG: DUF460 domain-containing protein [Candidatus Aenigmarchaeota archaeon]|nr:DUF460 domain-containing protein [Candidatus Aenigmarchaeota archaeon]